MKVAMKVQRKRAIVFSLLPLAFSLLSPQLLLAQGVPVRTPISRQSGCQNAIAEDSISQINLSNPSFWWASERFGGQVLDTWFACRDERRLDLVVDRQIWTLLDYLERYEFVNHFGQVARGYGYNLRVVNQQQTVLATYTCDFRVTPASCNLRIDTLGRQGFRRSLTGN